MIISHECRIKQKEIAQKAGLDLAKGRSLAIDGGANVGFWSKAMSEFFDRVIAFEPVPETFKFLEENLSEYPGVECRSEALMDRRGRVNIEMPNYSRKRQRIKGDVINRKSTARYVQWDDSGDIATIAIDDLDLSACDLIKLDLEGAEPLALIGAKKTIRKFKPVLIVEIKGHSKRFEISRKEVHKMIADMGYQEKFHSGKDWYYVSA